MLQMCQVLWKFNLLIRLSYFLHKNTYMQRRLQTPEWSNILRNAIGIKKVRHSSNISRQYLMAFKINKSSWFSPTTKKKIKILIKRPIFFLFFFDKIRNFYPWHFKIMDYFHVLWRFEHHHLRWYVIWRFRIIITLIFTVIKWSLQKKWLWLRS